MTAQINTCSRILHHFSLSDSDLRSDAASISVALSSWDVEVQLGVSAWQSVAIKRTHGAWLPDASPLLWKGPQKNSYHFQDQTVGFLSPLKLHVFERKKTKFPQISG